MNKVFFSPGTDCLNAIVSNIRNAKKSVKICVFTISDNRIVSAIESLKYKDVEVQIITDNDKRFDRGSDIIYLSEKGYNIKIDTTDAHMHHKFAVIDDKITITGSYNWTRSAEKYNQENILITDNQEITNAYLKEFAQLWEKMINLN